MFQYSKGKRTILKEEIQPIDEKIPDMINIEHSLSLFLKDYLNCEYFREE